MIGVDEAGRGPLAGPLLTAAVCLKPGHHPALATVRDSKILSPAARIALLPAILECAESVSIAWAHPRQIDRLNILRATLEAMGRAVNRSAQKIPEVAGEKSSAVGQKIFVLVDGNRAIPRLNFLQKTIVGGDDLSLSIACASVVAKVVRDLWMERISRRYPEYGFDCHKGYGTKEHLDCLARLGPSPVHRLSYAPVRKAAEARRASIALAP